jgi:hypothetical protein
VLCVQVHIRDILLLHALLSCLCHRLLLLLHLCLTILLLLLLGSGEDRQ